MCEKRVVSPQVAWKIILLKDRNQIEAESGPAKDGRGFEPLLISPFLAVSYLIILFRPHRVLHLINNYGSAPLKDMGLGCFLAGSR